MPTRERRRFIPRAIECFLSQTHTDSELVILDDGIDRVEDLVTHHSRIRYYHSQFRRTVGAKRNMACQAANGDVIAHWDDDDWSHPERLATQLELLKADPDTHLTGYHTLPFYREDGGRAFKYTNGSRSYACGTSFMFWREWWRSHEFLDMERSEDNTFLTHVGRAASIDGSQMMVAVQHGSNTCDKTPLVLSEIEKFREWKEIPVSELPEGFRRVACLG